MGIYADKALLEQKQIQALNEVYFGRTASINALFNAYCDWREPFVSNTKYLTSTLKNFYNKDIQIFIDMTQNQFGLKTFSYVVLNNEKVNSMTIFTKGERGPKNIKITKDGYRFTSNPAVAIGVFSGLCFNPEFSNEEVFAVFLHEIGHNFQTSANNTTLGLSIASTIWDFLFACLGVANGNAGPLITFLTVGTITANPVITILSELENKIKFDNTISSIFVTLTFIKSLIDYGKDTMFSILGLGTRPIKLIKIGINELLKNIKDPLHAIDAYYDERFADGFAASYGFGEALASGMARMDSKKTISNNIIIADLIGAVPIISHLYALACLPGMLLVSTADEHPIFEARAYSMLKDLKQDLKDPNLSPQLRKQLEEEIKTYEDSMDRYFREAKKITNPDIVNVLIQEFLYYKCGGGLKLNLSELPFNKIGGFRGETNKTAEWIATDKYSLKNVKII